jgi:hypothetical protein
VVLGAARSLKFAGGWLKRRCRPSGDQAEGFQVRAVRVYAVDAVYAFLVLLGEGDLLAVAGDAGPAGVLAAGEGPPVRAVGAVVTFRSRERRGVPIGLRPFEEGEAL